MSEITGPHDAIPPVIQLNEPPAVLPPPSFEEPVFTPTRDQKVG